MGAWHSQGRDLGLPWSLKRGTQLVQDRFGVRMDGNGCGGHPKSTSAGRAGLGAAPGVANSGGLALLSLPELQEQLERL